LGVELENSMVSQDVSFSASVPVKMELFNISGKRVNQFEANSGYNSFDLSNLNSGIFIAVFSTDDGKRAVTKLVKQ